MNQLLCANLRSHARRYVATGIAVAISTAFILAFLALGNGIKVVLEDINTAQYEGATVVVSPGKDFYLHDQDGKDSLEALVPTLKNLEGVGAAAPYSYAYLFVSKDGNRSQITAQALMPTPFFTPTPRVGSLPSSPDQIALDEDTASRLGVTVGDVLDAAPIFTNTSATHSVTVCALLPHATLAPETAVMTPQGLKAASQDLVSTSHILIASSDTSPSHEDITALSQAVTTALNGQDLDIQSADAAREHELQKVITSFAQMKIVLLVFPFISVIVAAIVVASTFRVLLTQRTRELALLRAVGTTRRQIRSLLLRETLLVGVVSSALGVLLGLLIAYGVLTGFGVLQVHQALRAVGSPADIGGAFALGTLMTLLAGLRPALAMGRLRPMEALANAEAENTSSPRSHKIALGVSFFVAALGAAGMAYGLWNRGSGSAFLLTFASGMVLLIAMMVAGVGLVPALARLWGLVAASATGKLARSNALRNPGRTASTGIAIAIGVTLITMMSVGAASTKATLETEVYSHYPYDLIVTDPSGVLSEEDLAQMTALDGVDAALGLREVRASVESVHNAEHALNGEQAEGKPGATQSQSQAGAESEPDPEAETDPFVSVQGVPDLTPVAHVPVEQILESHVRVHDDLAENGTLMRVCAEGGSCADFTAEVSEKLPYGQIQISAQALSKIAPQAPISTVVIKTSSEDVEGVQSRLLSLNPSYLVSGPALERQFYTKIINTILSIVIGLLAVSVLVALVGVTNTLALSVAERRRENGLLRALGMTKGEIQRMLAYEALIIALAGSTLGLLLGVSFGIAGTYSLPLEQIDQTIISIPWLILGAVVIGSVLAALAASWWPGHQAAKTSPVEALATE